MTLIKEKISLEERLEKLEFDNWTMRTTLSQMKQDGESAAKELAFIKVPSSFFSANVVTNTTRMTNH